MCEQRKNTESSEEITAVLRRSLKLSRVNHKHVGIRPSLKEGCHVTYSPLVNTVRSSEGHTVCFLAQMSLSCLGKEERSLAGDLIWKAALPISSQSTNGDARRGLSSSTPSAACLCYNTPVELHKTGIMEKIS